MSEYDPLSDDPNGPDDAPDDETESKPEYEARHEPGSSMLGEAARQRREVLGITQEEVAEKFGGPSVASLRTIENGQSDSYRAKTLFSLDAALAWPSGASMALLTGRMDRLSTQFNSGWNLDFLNDAWGFRTSGSTLSAWEYDTLVSKLVHNVSDEIAKKYDVPVWSATPPERKQPEVPSGTPQDPQSGNSGESPSLMELLEAEYEKDPPTVHENDRYNKVLVAMAFLNEDELEELGNFALNMARLSRILKGDAVQGRIEQWQGQGLERMQAIMKTAQEIADIGKRQGDKG